MGEEQNVFFDSHIPHSELQGGMAVWSIDDSATLKVLSVDQWHHNLSSIRESVRIRGVA